MNHTINVHEVFATLDNRKSDALATIAKYSEADQKDASRIAQVYDRCDATSIRHLVNTARILQSKFTPL